LFADGGPEPTTEETMVGKRLLAALAAFVLLAGFVAACGGDDDDDTSSDDTEESSDDEAVDGGEPITDFCAEFNSSDGGDTPIDEVQASLDRALAAQAETDDEAFAEALGQLAEFTEYVIDNDDGDEVITDAEAEAALGAFPGLPDSMSVVTDACAPGSRAANSADDEG
jgi:hypothetical protein